MGLPATLIIIVSFPDKKTGNAKVRAVFSGAAENKAHSFYIRNLNSCPSVEFFRINSEEIRFNLDEQREIKEFLRRLEE